MTSSTGKQVITTPILTKSQERKEIRQWNLVTYYNIALEMFFFKNHGENEVGRLVQDLVLFIGKTFTRGKSKWSAP